MPDRYSSTGSLCSCRISHNCTGRERYCDGSVSETSKTYLRCGRSPLSSMSAMPFEPRRTHLLKLSFHVSIGAQAMASGRCA
ncbi:MAG: hypothetical protein FWF15_00130 [Oscillospiraceae bacterium]|nr:hypothetical protein [Oscillospiraceae bacterium]